MANLLINEYPLIVIPSLAAKIGLNQAIFLQQVHYWIEQKRNIKDGKSWVYNTFEEWQKQFPFWSVRTIKRIVSDLEVSGILVSTSIYNRQNLNKKKWYTIDYDKFNRLAEELEINLASPANNTINKFYDNDLSKDAVENAVENNAELCKTVTFDNDNLPSSIVTSCPAPLCQFDTLDSDKIAIPSNITEITTENTTEITSDITPPYPPTEQSIYNKDKEEGEKEKIQSDLVLKRLYEVYARLHHKPTETEKRRLCLIFEAQGEKATEYAILCSEGKNSPMGYIIAILKDKSIFSALTKGEGNNAGLQFRENRFSNSYAKSNKSRPGFDTLPKSAEESKFYNLVPW